VRGDSAVHTPIIQIFDLGAFPSTLVARISVKGLYRNFIHKTLSTGKIYIGWRSNWLERDTLRITCDIPIRIFKKSHVSASKVAQNSFKRQLSRVLLGYKNLVQFFELI
jgi:hypothetical protein